MEKINGYMDVYHVDRSASTGIPRTPFLSLLIVSGSVWKQSYDDAVVPYARHQLGPEQGVERRRASLRSASS